MEYTIGEYSAEILKIVYWVLILIYMEYTIGGNLSSRKGHNCRVLILIYMEYTIGEATSLPIRASRYSLNPYLHGIYYRRLKKETDSLLFRQS